MQTERRARFTFDRADLEAAGFLHPGDVLVFATVKAAQNGSPVLVLEVIEVESPYGEVIEGESP